MLPSIALINTAIADLTYAGLVSRWFESLDRNLFRTLSRRQRRAGGSVFRPAHRCGGPGGSTGVPGPRSRDRPDDGQRRRCASGHDRNTKGGYDF